MQSLAFIKLVVFKLFFGRALLLLTSFTVVATGTGILSRNAEAASNPFEAYLDIFPGQPMSAVVARGFSCRVSHYHYAEPVQTLCVLKPSASIFASIEVDEIEQRVNRIKFALGADTFALGDLLLMFDLPQYRSHGPIAVAFWRDYVVSVPTNGGANADPLFQPVWSVTFTWADR